MSSGRKDFLLLLAGVLAGALACEARGGGPIDMLPPADAGDDATGDPDVPTSPDVTGPQCQSPQIECNGRCVSVLSDGSNCGMCGRVCAAGQSCANGVCTGGVTCSPPRTMCGGACTDTTIDPNNCGRCDNRCPSGQTCTNGTCVGGTTCPAPRTMCGAECVDTTISPNHCGRCNNPCASGQTCTNGTCAGGGTCSPPRTMCATGCTDINTDARNCGICGLPCDPGQSCVAGQCTTGTTCTPPRTICAGRCTDTSTDPSNCGGCGRPCSAGQACSAGVCRATTTCTPPRQMCSTGCTDVSSDPLNCGVCGVRCAAGQTCSAGRCTGGGGTTSPAGNACTSDATCGALQCPPNLGFCTDGCFDDAPSAEQAACGGTGSTCLLLDEDAGEGICTRSCTPGSASSCRAGFVCTGFSLFNSTPDSPGCYPHCTTNAQCPSGLVCDTRFGTCGMRAANLAGLADGSACNPSVTMTVPGEMTPRNTQCRGRCFRVSATSMTQGLCGSLVNAALTPSCPDANTLPSGVMGDDLIACIFRSCTRSTECGSGLVCIYPEQAGAPVMTAPRICNYPTRAQPTGS